MCFSENMSLGFAGSGLVASVLIVTNKNNSIETRIIRATTVLFFAAMELIQYFAFPVIGQCGYGTNLFLSKLVSHHLLLQPAIVTLVLATYSTDKKALGKAFILSALIAIFNLLNYYYNFPEITTIKLIFSVINEKLLGHKLFLGNVIECLLEGKYHMAFSIKTNNEYLVASTIGFGIGFSGFLWKNSHRITTYLLFCFIVTYELLFRAFNISEGEASAIYCFYSVPVCLAFLPYFDKFFTVKEKIKS